MPLNGRFPMYPGRAAGFLYGRGSSTLVVWTDDQTVEEPPDFSATQDDLDAFVRLLDDIRARIAPRSWADAHDAILEAGWEDRGMLQYDIRSGHLLVDTAALAEMAEKLWDERERILLESGGRQPEMGSPVWSRWVEVTVRRNAAVRGARALGIAAVEALINELLAVQHPGEYADLEMRRRAGFRSKLAKLLELQDLDLDDVAWFGELEAHADLRNSMIHHRPSWVVDHRDSDSVAPDDDMTQECLMETLEVVHHAVVGLFGLYGTMPPDTHRPGWLQHVAGW